MKDKKKGGFNAVDKVVKETDHDGNKIRKEE